MTVDKVQLAEGVVRAREALDDGLRAGRRWPRADRKSTRLNSSHDQISYAVFCLKKKHRPARLGLCFLRTPSVRERSSSPQHRSAVRRLILCRGAGALQSPPTESIAFGPSPRRAR